MRIRDAHQPHDYGTGNTEPDIVFQGCPARLGARASALRPGARSPRAMRGSNEALPASGTRMNLLPEPADAARAANDGFNPAC
jgi:hypothetical protein